MWSFLTLCLLRALPRRAQVPDVKSDLAANAAMKYWQAFAQLPAIDKDQEKVLENWDKIPIDAAVLKLLNTSRSSLTYLRRGAKLQHCDWSLDYDDGIGLLMPQLAKARVLARLAGLQARHDFEKGRIQDGVENLTAMLTLARHLGSDPFLISSAVRCGIESMAIETLAIELPRLDPATLRNLSARLDKLPPGATLEQGLLWEKKYALESVDKILHQLEKENKGDLQASLKMILNVEGNLDSIKGIPTFENAFQLLHDLGPLYEQQAKLVSLPPVEFDKQYPEFIKRASAANAMAGALLPVIDKLIGHNRRNEAQMALLRAATAIVQGGPDKLKDFKDPFGQGPFEYRALTQGFELKSKLLYRDQPVTLVVGQRKKE